MFAAAARSRSFQNTLDWAIFSIGAFALATAIVATALPNSDSRLAGVDTMTVAQPAS